MSKSIAALLMSTLLSALAPLSAGAQGQPSVQGQAPTQSAPRAVGATLDFANAKIADLAKDPKARAIMEKYLPELSDHYAQIGHMSLTEAAMGELDEPLIRKMKAEYDKD